MEVEFRVTRLLLNSVPVTSGVSVREIRIFMNIFTHGTQLQNTFA